MIYYGYTNVMPHAIKNHNAKFCKKNLHIVVQLGNFVPWFKNLCGLLLFTEMIFGNFITLKSQRSRIKLIGLLVL